MEKVMRILPRMALAVLIFHLAACSSMQTVPIRDVKAGGDDSPVFPGDRVEVVTRDDETLTFPVTDITDEGISGKFGFIPYNDIRKLSVRRSGTTDSKATYWILGVLAAAGAIALVASADSVTVCSGAPCPNDPEGR